MPGQLAEISAADVRLAAMDLLARREHSRDELRRKLLCRFSDSDLVGREIDRLAAENLQSDDRFAGSYLRQRVGRGYGPLRIRGEMRQRGIGDEGIAQAFAAAGCDWNALAARALERKFGTRPCADLREKARRSRFLQYRGFAFEHFAHLVD